MKIQPNQQYNNNYSNYINQQKSIDQNRPDITEGKKIDQVKDIKPEEQVQKQKEIQEPGSEENQQPQISTKDKISISADAIRETRPVQDVKATEELGPEEKVNSLRTNLNEYGLKPSQVDGVQGVEGVNKVGRTKETDGSMNIDKVRGNNEINKLEKPEEIRGDNNIGRNVNDIDTVNQPQEIDGDMNADKIGANIKDIDKLSPENVKKISEDEGIKPGKIDDEGARRIAGVAREDLKTLLQPDKMVKPMDGQGTGEKVSDALKNKIKDYISNDGTQGQKGDKDKEINDINQDPGKFLKEQKGQPDKVNENDQTKGNKKPDVKVDLVMDPKIGAGQTAAEGRDIAHFEVEVSGQDSNKIDKQNIKKKFMQLQEENSGQKLQIPDSGDMKADGPMKINFMAPQGRLGGGELVMSLQGMGGKRPFESYMEEQGKTNEMEAGKEYLEKNPQASDAQEVREKMKVKEMQEMEQ